jgi:hypothetical protein
MKNQLLNEEIMRRMITHYPNKRPARLFILPALLLVVALIMAFKYFKSAPPLPASKEPARLEASPSATLKWIKSKNGGEYREDICEQFSYFSVTVNGVEDVICEPTPTPTPKVSPDKIVSFIHKKESGNGTAPAGLHVYCRNLGKWNEIGWGQYQKHCFENEAEGLATLRQAITERLAKNPPVEVLCVYQGGFRRDENGKRIPYETCKYWQEFAAFAKL